MKCPECGSTVIKQDASSGVKYCGKCGLILSERELVHGKKTVNSDSGLDAGQHGRPVDITKYEKGLTTLVGGADIDLARLSRKERSKYRRLAKIQAQVVGRERGHKSGFDFMKQLASELGISLSVIEGAFLKYRKLVEIGAVRGRAVEVVASALVYMELKKAGIPRTVSEIARLAGVNRGVLSRNISHFSSFFDEEVVVSTPESYIPRFASKIGVSDKIKSKAVEIILKAKDKSLIKGKDPGPLAAGALLVAVKLEGVKVSASRISRETGVSRTSLRKVERLLKKGLGVLKAGELGFGKGWFGERERHSFVRRER